MVGTNTTGSWDDEDEDADEDLAWGTFDEITTSGDDESMASDGVTDSMFFTVTNPPGTVSVTAMGDGMPVRVDLAPKVVNMTEAQLTDEICVIATLASRHAKAGQHLIISSLMQRMGHDRVSARSFVEYELGLPSVETVLAEKADVFADRYTDDDR